MKARPSTRRRSRLGQSLIEFALIGPIFMILLLGVLDLGRVGLFYVSSSALARQGVRYAADWNNGTGFTNCQIVAYVKQQSDATMMANLTEPGGCAGPPYSGIGTTTPPSPLTAGYQPPIGSAYIFIDRSNAQYVTVSIVYAFRPTSPMISDLTGTIYTVATTSMNTEY